MELNKGTRKRRGNSRYYLFFFFALIGVAIIGLGIWFGLTNIDLFKFQKMQISGNKVIPDTLFYKITSPYIGMNLFTVPSSEIKAKLNTLSRVKNVKLHKRLPDTIKLDITERKAAIYLKTIEGDLYPVDSEGVVLIIYTPVYKEDIPIYSTYLSNNQIKPGIKLKYSGLQKVLQLHQRVVKEAPDFLPQISEYYLIDNTINIIDAKTGTRIIPSEEDFATQISRYRFVQENGNINRNSVVDLRFKNQVVVKAGNK
ncbi:MAG TPA: FtsQ-type POTRA domain-containing protein [Candidatus Cloacimonas sp.]|nr:FtsQ-type POTRA domain-containing protein [Candidatus Cloacimonas sp.]